ncbi:Periplasmic protein [Croceitalea dokdonensis DOKDO 023]|uniref:Periplasmic protein n=1 Tax=Croceitalea dokdonensis DOKDO 023 TaxID=1300341 RepID=A0A0P7AFR3_9FLAO|nr:alkaline phosphatase family protein [Croceitalea dokdonensis]KPM32178.1 Periplasmic protein [Croceitalea dokdonensis DOKDO 023]
MFKSKLALVITIFMGTILNAQSKNSKVVLITLDGLRWQELFSGADSLLVANEAYVSDTVHLKERFWKETPQERREVLMPFIWKEVARMGQIYGNRDLGSNVDLTNKMCFSYPGYNEILSGKADDKRINSNNKVPNPNKTILEVANKDPKYNGKVAAFGSWDVFPFIINEQRSGVPVNAGFEIAQGKDLTEREKFLNELQPQVPSPWGSVRLDAFTHHYALEYMKKTHPELIYIAYGETDDFAHDGDYDAYLKAAHNTDALIKDVWEFTQNDPFYKNNTLFIVTTDHGRGTKPLESWMSHGEKVPDSAGVWILIFGKDVTAKGEIKHNEPLYGNQIAPTIAKAMNLKMGTTSGDQKSLEIPTN